MPSRRPVTGRSLSALLVAVLAFALSAPSVAAVSAGAAHTVAVGPSTAGSSVVDSSGPSGPSAESVTALASAIHAATSGPTATLTNSASATARTTTAAEPTISAIQRDSIANDATIAGQPTVSAMRRASDGDGRLRGQLRRLVASASAGTLSGSAYSGLETTHLALGPGVAVSLHLGSGGAHSLNALVATGARIANRRGDDVEAYLPPPALRTLATATGIDRAEPILRPVPLGTGIGLVGEGVALHKADQWQAAGITGTGVKVGIIDGGFIGLTARLGRELPASVHARCYTDIGLYSSTAKSCEAFTEHGTAVAETIADMAPGVSLYLSDPVSPQDLESTVDWMTTNGVKIINISLGFAFEGPGDTSTPPPDSIYAIVNQAVKGGALWVNAAGNAGEDGWTGTWKDADHDGLLEFSGTDESDTIPLVAGDSIVVTMRWNDPWGRAANDYDLYVFGANGNFPLAASEDTQDGHGDPVESLSFSPSTSGVYRIVIERAGGTSASKIQLLVLTSEDSPLQYRTPDGTLPSPADSSNPGEISVGAVAFDAPDVIESYSSRGPTPDGRIKPDIVAADCTTTSLLNPFCGTSESAPYAAGAAALVLQARPTLTPAQLATWLRTHAIPLGRPSPNATFGSGRLDLGTPPQPPTATTLAFTTQPALAVAAVPLTPAPTVTIKDQDGLPLTTGSSAASPVTLGLGNPPAGATLTCPGGTTQAAVAGVATFTGCTISTDGTAVTLVATSGALPAAISAPFNVLPVGSLPAPALTTSTSASAIGWSSAVTLRGQIALSPSAPLPSPLAGRTVTFDASPDRATWHTVGQGTTDATGAATITYRPITNLYYRASFAGAADLGAATGTVLRVTVRQLITMRPTNNGTTKTVPRDRTITFTATVRPARPDVPPGTVTFEIYHQTGSTWRLVATQSATPTATGIAALDVTFNSPGSWYVRAMATPTHVNANSLWTPQEHYRVL
jgi:hypothetical protein